MFFNKKTSTEIPVKTTKPGFFVRLLKYTASDTDFVETPKIGKIPEKKK